MRVPRGFQERFFRPKFSCRVPGASSAVSSPPPQATVSIAPALSLVAHERTRRVSGSSKLLIVGDPETPPGALDRLRYAGEEIDAIRTLFPGPGTVIQRGSAASPGAFLGAAPSTFALIHFAAHATASATSPLDSSIELSADAAGRFKLYARDVAEAELGADLVTISACRGAGDRAYAGEGQVGLAWAFLRAGASRVIAGLWDVDDRSTALLMHATYAAMAAGRTPADALRDAVDTNRVSMGVTTVQGVERPMLLLVAAIDNLLKGAAGQAVQNMNLMFDLPEATGLPC